MIIIHVPVGVPQCQIDDFPEGCERSVKGAIHFSPTCTREITPGEWSHIKVAHPSFAAKVNMVLDQTKKKAAPVAKPEEKKAAAVEPPASPAVLVNEEKPRPSRPNRS